MGIFLDMRSEIENLAEQDYKQFSGSLLPGIDHVLGVRLPELRKLAKQIAASDWQEYLAGEPYYFEENMLQGMVIGVISVSPEERLQYMTAFIPRIDNWSVCDSFCCGLKFAGKHQALVWDYLQPWLQSGEEYSIRFAVVMMMNYYLNDGYIDRVLSLLDDVKHDAYYVKMAVAWALATALAKQPDKTWNYFQHHHLDNDTWRKTIQKCIESRRISDEQKAILREWRNKL